MTFAEIVAKKLNSALETGDVQICNYARRFIIKRGSVMKVDGNCMRVNGRGAAFIAGTFKAYAQ